MDHSSSHLLVPAPARRLAPLSIALIVAACTRLPAPDTSIVPDRPGYSDSPAVVQPHSVQLEAGYTDTRTSGTSYRSAGETLLRFGLTRALEARVFGNSYALSEASGAPAQRGFEDLKLGAKLVLHEVPDSVHGWVPSLAALAAVTLPTGTPGISGASAQPEAKLAAAWTTATPFSVVANLGMDHTFRGPAQGTRAWGSVSAAFAATTRVSFVADLMQLSPVNGAAQASAHADAGITVLLTPQFQADIRLGRGLGGPAGADRFIGAGFARRW